MPPSQELISLGGLLNDFSVRVNSLDNLRALLLGWAPEFYIQARDVGDTFRIYFEQGSVQKIEPVEHEPSDEALLLRADMGVLEKIFTGTLSPLSAYTQGVLEVYGSAKDQVKLDLIALLVWGA